MPAASDPAAPGTDGPDPAAPDTAGPDTAAPDTATGGSAPAATRRSVLAAALLDAACVLAFVGAGRSTHAEDRGVAGVLGTAWPFLVAAALGWLAVRAWRSPARLWPVGVVVWGVTWTGGLTLRGLAGGGLAPAFVAVAAVSLAVLLLGWRGLATAISLARRAGPRRTTRPRTSGPARRR